MRSSLVPDHHLQESHQEIVPVVHFPQGQSLQGIQQGYELEYVDSSSASPVVIKSKVLKGNGDWGRIGFAWSPSSVSEGPWRVRAVIRAHIRGPWAEVADPGLDVLVRTVRVSRTCLFPCGGGCAGRWMSSGML